MRMFYSTVNGMGDHYDEKGFFRFWPLEQIKPVSQYRYNGPEIVSAIPELIDYYLFFDHSIDLFIYAIRLQHNEILPSSIRSIYPQLCSRTFSSLTEFISTYVYKPDDLFG